MAARTRLLAHASKGTELEKPSYGTWLKVWGPLSWERLLLRESRPRPSPHLEFMFRQKPAGENEGLKLVCFGFALIILCPPFSHLRPTRADRPGTCENQRDETNGAANQTPPKPTETQRPPQGSLTRRVLRDRSPVPHPKSMATPSTVGDPHDLRHRKTPT